MHSDRNDVVRLQREPQPNAWNIAVEHEVRFL
jgi:hypothetical protein